MARQEIYTREQIISEQEARALRNSYRIRRGSSCQLDRREVDLDNLPNGRAYRRNMRIRRNS